MKGMTFYYDLEFSTDKNTCANGDLFAGDLITFFTSFIVEVLDVQIERIVVIALDASNPSKFSKHLMFHVYVRLDDATYQLVFERTDAFAKQFYKLFDLISSNSNPQSTYCVNPGLSETCNRLISRCTTLYPLKGN